MIQGGVLKDMILCNFCSFPEIEYVIHNFYQDLLVRVSSISSFCNLAMINVSFILIVCLLLHRPPKSKNTVVFLPQCLLTWIVSFSGWRCRHPCFLLPIVNIPNVIMDRIPVVREEDISVIFIHLPVVAFCRRDDILLSLFFIA